MRRSSESRTASRSIRTVSLILALLVFLPACKIDKSAESEREERQRGADRPRTVFGDEPEKAAKDDAPPDSKARAPNDANTRTQPPKELPSKSKPPATTAESATRTRTDEQAAQTPAPADDPGKAPKEIGGRVLRYQPPGTRIGDPGELAAKTRIERQPQAAHPIVALIHHWADTLLSKDLNAHMALYTPVLARFHGRTNVDHESVRTDKQRLLATLANVRKFEIYDLTIREDAGAGLVFAVFRAEWQTSAPSDSSRVTWYRLICSRNGSRWQIEGEEQLNTGT